MIFVFFSFFYVTKSLSLRSESELFYICNQCKPVENGFKTALVYMQSKATMNIHNPIKLISFMKKIITSILTAVSAFVLSASNANALNPITGTNNDYNQGGKNVELPFAMPNQQPDPFIYSLSSSFGVGWISGINQANGVDIDMGGSIELEWANVISAKARITNNDLVRVGLSLDWRNYRMTNGKMFNKDDNTGQISITDFPEGVEPKFSRIHTFSLNIPVKYYHRFGKYVAVSAGPELCFTPYASIKNRFYENGVKVKDKDRVYSYGIHQNVVSVNLGAEVNVCGIGVYYKYSPINVLNTNYGPKFGSMTVGLRVGM